MVEIKEEAEPRTIKFVCEVCKYEEIIKIKHVREMGSYPWCPACLRLSGGISTARMMPSIPIAWLKAGLTAYGYCREHNHSYYPMPGYPPREECYTCGDVRTRSQVMFESPDRCGVCGTPCSAHILSPGMRGDKKVEVCPKCRPLYGVKVLTKKQQNDIDKAKGE